MASRPLPATVTWCPRLARNRTATFWFTRLSSASRISQRPHAARETRPPKRRSGPGVRVVRVQGKHDGVEQLRLLDRLDHVLRRRPARRSGAMSSICKPEVSSMIASADGQCPRSAAFSRTAKSRRRRACGHRSAPADSCGLRCGRGFERFQSRRGRFDDRRPQLPVAQHLGQHLPVGGIVVDHQHRQIGSVGPQRRFRRPVGGRIGEAGREVERAAGAELALHPDPAAHQVGQPRGNGQAQPRAAVASAWSNCRPARRRRRSVWCFSGGMPMPVSLTVKCRLDLLAHRPRPARRRRRLRPAR